MDREGFGQLIDIGLDVLSAVIDATTKIPLLQIGDAVSSTAMADRAEHWQQAGFTSIPAAPTAGSPSCQVISIKQGGRRAIIATRDARASTIYGSLKPGETCVYATAGQARVMLKKDGSITRVTTSDNTPGGVTISDRLGPDGWTLTTPWGELSLTAQGLSLMVSGAGAITISPEGILKMFATQASLQGSLVCVSGDTATVLGPKATPTPLNACAYSSVGPVNVVSTNVFIST